MVDKEVFFIFYLIFILVDPGPELFFGEPFFRLKRAQITDKGSKYFRVDIIKPPLLQVLRGKVEFELEFFDVINLTEIDKHGRVQNSHAD